MLTSLSVAFICLAPLFISVGGIVLIRRIRGEHRRKKPFSEEQRGLRWAGYSLERELETLSEKMDSELLMTVVIPALSIATYATAAYRHEEAQPAGIAVAIVAMAGLGWSMGSLFRNASVSRRKRLGMRGEQMVGEILNSLMRDGFFVFHDFPVSGRNIDHIVIGETGVFSVETKARRKHKKVSDGKGECDLDFDGERINYPEQPRFEVKPVHQARRSARALEKFLEERSKVRLPVTPLLVFPGWFVNRRGKSDIFVLNHTEIHQVVRDKKREKLPKDILERVVAVVDAQCRDVVW
jgi:hypothetical protein